MRMAADQPVREQVAEEDIGFDQHFAVAVSGPQLRDRRQAGEPIGVFEDPRRRMTASWPGREYCPGMVWELLGLECAPRVVHIISYTGVWMMQARDSYLTPQVLRVEHNCWSHGR